MGILNVTKTAQRISDARKQLLHILEIRNRSHLQVFHVVTFAEPILWLCQSYSRGSVSEEAFLDSTWSVGDPQCPSALDFEGYAKPIQVCLTPLTRPDHGFSAPGSTRSGLPRLPECEFLSVNHFGRCQNLLSCNVMID